MKLTDKEKFATRVGAILAIVGFMISLVAISAIDSSYAEAIDEETGYLVPGKAPLWSTNETGDLLNPPRLTQSGCSPVVNTDMTGDFDDNSSFGGGTMWNGTGGAPLLGCSGAQYDKIYYINYQSDLDVGEIVDMGGEVISFGINVPANPGNASVRIGIVPAWAGGTQGALDCPTCSEIDIASGEEILIPLTADMVAFFESFPDQKLAVTVISDESDPLAPGFGDVIEMDLTVYGEDYDYSLGSVTDSFVKSLGADMVLASMYYIVALISMVAGAMIWPSSTLDKLSKKFGRS